jgi:hypothetical protein
MNTRIALGSLVVAFVMAFGTTARAQCTDTGCVRGSSLATVEPRAMPSCDAPGCGHAARAVVARVAAPCPSEPCATISPCDSPPCDSQPCDAQPCGAPRCNALPRESRS